VSNRLISLNIEGRKHLPEVLSFLTRERPDIACLQEVYEDDLPRLTEGLGMSTVFAAMRLRPDAAAHGNAILSRLPIRRHEVIPYMKQSPAYSFFVPGTEEEKALSQEFNLLSADIEMNGTLLKVITTHFPWTADGRATDFQREALVAMLQKLSLMGDFALCGDFNAPRGGEIFAAIAQEYTDNVPASYTTSIDPGLHRAGPLPYMVDGMFSTEGIEIRDVSMKSGISDHCALLGHASPVREPSILQAA
jgi:endonuclease/exonuclease/phosphatase family metal-dependent hydrolase